MLKIKVNNVSIVSANSIRGITGGSIVFADNSFINVTKGIRSNWGQAVRTMITPADAVAFEGGEPANYAEILAELLESRKLKRVSKQFPGRKMEVNNVPGAIVNIISQANATGITVEMSGPAGDLDVIEVIEQLGTVRISNPEPSSVVGNMQIIGSIISTDSLTISVNAEEVNPEEIVTITVKVPKGSEVSLRGDWAEATIDDLLGPIEVVSDSAGPTNIGEVTTAKISVTSRGSVIAQKVSGDTTLRSSGSGSVTVLSGTVPELKAFTSSRGHIHFGGSSSSAVVTNSGSGSIRVSKVTNTLSIELSSSGPVTVDSADTERTKISSSSAGTIEVKDAKTQSLIIDQTSRGNVHFLGTVHDRIKVRNTGSGHTVVTGGQVNSLNINIESSGNVTFNGSAQTATVITESAGSITVLEVLDSLTANLSSRGHITVNKINAQRAKIDSSGAGNIWLKNGSISSLQVRVDSSGNFTFNGSVVDATLRTTSKGNISVNQVTGKLNKSETSRGRVRIG